MWMVTVLEMSLITKCGQKSFFLCGATSNSCYTRVFHALFNDGNASCHQPNGNARPVFNVTKWCPTTIDYNMTYTWFWTAHGSAGKHKYQCFHYLFVYVETASLVLGKHPRVFSKRLLHIINKNVKVRVFPVLATASIFLAVISQFYTRS